MVQLSPDDIQDLVTKAFVLEAITDKPGCTTRYTDLPGKPLQDFVIAGINSGRYFRQFAAARQSDETAPLYTYAAAALSNSNRHKSPKYVNFGLLEIMFPVVAARLAADDPSKVIDTASAFIKASTKQDVLALLETRKVAWSTSQTAHKIGFLPQKYRHHTSVWDFYMALHADFPVGNSNHEWTAQFKQGLPMLRSFYSAYNDAGEIMQTTKSVYMEQRAANPNVAGGIVADMCAAAIFLWLSYNYSAV